MGEDRKQGSKERTRWWHDRNHSIALYTNYKLRQNNVCGCGAQTISNFDKQQTFSDFISLGTELNKPGNWLIVQQILEIENCFGFIAELRLILLILQLQLGYNPNSSGKLSRSARIIREKSNSLVLLSAVSFSQRVWINQTTIYWGCCGSTELVLCYEVILRCSIRLLNWECNFNQVLAQLPAGEDKRSFSSIYPTAAQDKLASVVFALFTHSIMTGMPNTAQHCRPVLVSTLEYLKEAPNYLLLAQNELVWDSLIQASQRSLCRHFSLISKVFAGTFLFNNKKMFMKFVL